MQTDTLLNYYLTMNMNNICRICLEKSNKLTPIFDPIKPPHFSVLIMACAAVQVQEGDGLPPYICQRCISRLNIAFQFKTQCESSDTKLRQCFENYNLPNAPDFSGFATAEKSDGNVVYQPNGPHEVASPEIKQAVVPIEEMQLHHVVSIEQDLGDKTNPKFKDPDLIQSKTEETESSINNAVITEYKIELGTDQIKNEASTLKLGGGEIMEKNVRSRKSLKVHQCDTCGKVFKIKPSLVHHIRIHTGERPYVCHLCQKSFVNGGHLHTHMRTHTGEKNHICVSCNKAFATAQQLMKHTIAIHTSERPYICVFCGKRFASSSNMNTHIKIHTGEKNFHCEYCVKTFSTKGQLQQHMLVHTGEKAFLCEYCNKRFSQKAHLIRHLKTHKANQS